MLGHKEPIKGRLLFPMCANEGMKESYEWEHFDSFSAHIGAHVSTHLLPCVDVGSGPMVRRLTF